LGIQVQYLSPNTLLPGVQPQNLKSRNYKIYFSGNSGGGMVLKDDKLWKLVGIVSAAVAKKAEIYGKNQTICDLNNYLVYTDVSKFSDWIDQVIQETF
jgi:secreted trypsin-like serine protease